MWCFSSKSPIICWGPEWCEQNNGWANGLEPSLCCHGYLPKSGLLQRRVWEEHLPVPTMWEAHCKWFQVPGRHLFGGDQNLLSYSQMTPETFKCGFGFITTMGLWVKYCFNQFKKGHQVCDQMRLVYMTIARSVVTGARQFNHKTHSRIIWVTKTLLGMLHMLLLARIMMSTWILQGIGPLGVQWKDFLSTPYPLTWCTWFTSASPRIMFRHVWRS